MIHLESVSVVKEVLSNHVGSFSIEFSKYNSTPHFQERLQIDKSIEELLKEGLQIRGKYNLPFWDSLLLASFNRNNMPDQLFQEVLFHKKNFDIVCFESNNWNDINAYLSENSNQNIAISSKIIEKKTKEHKHLQLFDFHIPFSNSNTSIVKSIIKSLGLQGYILNSGKSYHFYGKTLIEENDFHLLLAKALLFSPIIDKAWIAHQIIETCCHLRVTKKNGIIPYLVEEI